MPREDCLTFQSNRGQMGKTKEKEQRKRKKKDKKKKKEINNFNGNGPAVKSEIVNGNVKLKSLYYNQQINMVDSSDGKRFGAIKPDLSFTGRTNELSKLDACYEKPPNDVVVFGLGGIGKTSLVRKYVEDEKFNSHNVIWINAIKQKSIKRDFRKLAKLLIPSWNSKKKDFESILDEVLSKLCKFPTLIVLDNVDDEEVKKFVMEFVIPFRPSGEHMPRYIITSRIQNWRSVNLVHLVQDGLTDTEAILLVTRLLDDVGSHRNDSPEDATKLATIFQNFPLAIRQATAHIKCQRKKRQFSISNYIDEYHANKEEYLSSMDFQEEIFFQYKKTIFTTWSDTIAAIANNKSSGDLAVRILRMMAFFKADHIRRDIFFHLNHPSTYVESAIALLVKYSMIEGHEHQSILSVHRLVQSVMKIEMEKNAEMSCSALRDGLNVLNEALKTQCCRGALETLEHGMSVFQSASTMETLVSEFSFFPSMMLQKANECDREQIRDHLINILGAKHPDIITKITTMFDQLMLQNGNS